MSRPLIINARHRLPWHKRLFSDASTAMAWGGWLWLWSPFLRSAAVADVGARSYPALVNLLTAGSGDGIQHSVLALLGTSGTLLVWNKLPARKAPSADALSLREYARHFDLPEDELEAGRSASVCVVHHDASGRIVQVQCRDRSPEPLALAG